MKHLTWILSALALLAGCIAHPSPGFEREGDPGGPHAGPAGEGDAEDGDDQPWTACDDGNPCVAWAYCDELGASESPLCDHRADLSCRLAPAPEGLSCFPTADVGVGHCDGRGTCR